MRASARVGALLFACFALGGASGAEEPCARLNPDMGDGLPRWAIFSDVFVEPVSGVNAAELQGSIDLWSACGETGNGFPRLTASRPATNNYYRVRVTYGGISDSGDGKCGLASGNELRVWAFTRVNNQVISCGDRDQTIAHELGHWFGLDDAPEQSECSSHIMTELDRTNNDSRSLQKGECELVDLKWKMLDREDPGPDPVEPRPTPPGERPIDRQAELCAEMPEFCNGEVPWWEVSELHCEHNYIDRSDGIDVILTCFLLTEPGLSQLQPGVFQGPRIGISWPLPGSTVSGTLALAGFASDADRGTQHVELWLDGQPITLGSFATHLANATACIGSPSPDCPNVGFSGTLDTRLLPNGVHTLSVIGAENRVIQPAPGIAEVTFTVNNPVCETVRPVTAIVAPGSGATVAATTLVRATASDNVGITKVELLVDGVLKLVDSAAPYEFQWNTTLWPDGAHTLETRAWDACGNRTRSAVVPVTVSNPPPPPPPPTAPAIEVRQAWDAAIVAEGSVFTFPTQPVGQGDTRRFAITNLGTAPLTLNDPSGFLSAPCFAQVTTPAELPISPVQPGQTTHFRLRFLCTTAGFASAQVSIVSNDPGDSPFVFTVAGTATNPEFPVLQVSQAWDAAPVAAGSVVPFPNTPPNASVSRRFAITNSGTAPLVLSNPLGLVTGACFSQVTTASEVPVTPVAPGQTTHFRVRLLCATSGTHTGTVTVESDAPGEQGFSFQVMGVVN